MQTKTVGRGQSINGTSRDLAPVIGNYSISFVDDLSRIT